MTLIDLALAGGLIVMIMLSGYENFVSKLDVADAEKSISWLGKLDTGTLKLKVSATIVTISAVQLLKAYLEINAIANDKLLWLVVIHLTFVVSALLLRACECLLRLAIGIARPRLTIGPKTARLWRGPHLPHGHCGGEVSLREREYQ